jgi:hypothetical protein
MTTYKVKSVTISRKPGKDKEGMWSAFIGLFDENNPHLKARAPKEVLEIKEVEKVRINELRNISYYLMGNDIVINDLIEVNFEKEDNILTLTGKQEF